MLKSFYIALIISIFKLTTSFLNFLLPEMDNVYADILYRSSTISFAFITTAYYTNISSDFNAQLNKFTLNKLRERERNIVKSTNKILMQKRNKLVKS